MKYLSLCYVKLFSSYQSRNISKPPELLTERHLNQDQKVHFKSTLQKKFEGRTVFRGKLLYIVSCTIFSKNPDPEGSSTEAEVPTHAVPRSVLSRSWDSVQAWSSLARLRLQGHCSCWDLKVEQRKWIQSPHSSTLSSSKYFNEIHFTTAVLTSVTIPKLSETIQYPSKWKGS